MKVKICQLSDDQHIAIVPEDYCNSARNISKLTEAAGITEPTSWMILYEDTFEEVKL